MNYNGKDEAIKMITHYFFLIILWGFATFKVFSGQMSDVHYLLACMMLILGGMMINLFIDIDKMKVDDDIEDMTDSFTNTIVWKGSDED